MTYANIDSERLAEAKRFKPLPKPRLLIIGHARHGKDTVAEMIRDQFGLVFKSSSIFVGERCLWETWGKERYSNFHDMFEDRVNHRTLWANLISAYNTPNKARTATEMLTEEGCDMYVGMRMKDEFDACMAAGIFDHVIWVDACGRLEKEPRSSNEMTADLADIHIDNNGPEKALKTAITNLQTLLHTEGYDVGRRPTIAEGAKTAAQFLSEETGPPQDEPIPELGSRPTWEDMPEHAIQVLDHGFFKVGEVMGSDAEIAGAARMSYGRGTKSVNKDEGLINYLVKNHHTSPLEMGEIRFHMRMPIFVMRQMVRHRTANLNEYSGRYSQMVRLFYSPGLNQICTQHATNKQMSGIPLPTEEALIVSDMIEKSSNASFDQYEALLDKNVSRETARMILPLNTYTEVVWKLDVSNLIKFLYLRDDNHAQWEIREYAIKIAEAVEHYFPLVYAAYKANRDSVTLNERQLIALLDRDVSGLPRGETQAVLDIFNTWCKDAEVTQ